MRTTRIRTIVMLAFGWYVVTYSGQKVAGPFTMMNDCNELAKVMAKKFYNVATMCQYSND